MDLPPRLGLLITERGRLSGVSILADDPADHARVMQFYLLIQSDVEAFLERVKARVAEQAQGPRLVGVPNARSSPP